SGSQKDAWQNGNLGSSQAHYAEGEFVPYRAVYTGLTEGTTYWTTIEWDTTQGGKHALDYIGSYNFSFPSYRNETIPDPTSGVTAFLGDPLASLQSLAIPLDTKVTYGANGVAGGGDDISPVAGSFSLFGGVANVRFVQAGNDGLLNTA